MFVGSQGGYRAVAVDWPSSDRTTLLITGQRHVSRTASTAPATESPVGEPCISELRSAPLPHEAFYRIAALPHAVFFDSARRHDTLGRYSYLAADPIRWFTRNATGDPLSDWRREFPLRPAQRIEGLPPWQGGAAGVIGYEIGRTLERLPSARWDEFGTPVLSVGVYDWVLAYDHVADRQWLIAHGSAASERVEQVMALLEGQPPRKVGKGKRSVAA